MLIDDLFSVADRERVQERVLHLAASDSRVVAGAVVGSLAISAGDRWSDLDLTFGVADDRPMLAVLEDWSRVLAAEFNAVQLFDLPAGASIYRVFLLPGCLQFDLSFSPASRFGAMGPKFKLLFGSAVDRPQIESPPARTLFGYAVHHALRARFCIERGRFWQAEYWISATRDYALNLACRRLDLSTAYGRGYDDLPAESRDRFAAGLVTSLEQTELLRAFGSVVEALLRETAEVQDVELEVEAQLHKLCTP